MFSQITTPSAESIGLFVLIAIMLTRWLWDYSRNRDEAAAKHEPRANPPLHKEYASKDEHEKGVTAAKVALERFRDETNVELKRGAARRAEIYDEQKTQGERLVRVEGETQRQSADLTAIKNEMKEMQERITAVPARTIQLLLDAQKLSGSKK